MIFCNIVGQSGFPNPPFHRYYKWPTFLSKSFWILRCIWNWSSNKDMLWCICAKLADQSNLKEKIFIFIFSCMGYMNELLYTHIYILWKLFITCLTGCNTWSRFVFEFFVYKMNENFINHTLEITLSFNYDPKTWLV